MADIAFSGNKKLKSINKEFCAQFPYIYLAFHNEDGKVVKNWDVTHASIRGSKAQGELSANPIMKASTFEKRYEEAFGCKVEITFENNGRNYKTSGTRDEMTLKDLNEWVKNDGSSNILEVHPDWF